MEDDDISSIDSLSDNILDEEDDKEMLGLLSEMVFTAKFEKYVKNSITKLINNNFKNIEPLFIIKEYSLQETIEEFQNFSTNIIKEKKIINKSFNIQLKLIISYINERRKQFIQSYYFRRKRSG